VKLRTRIMKLVTNRKRAADRRSRGARRRGSVIVLVAAVLVMVVMIGTAYITSARFDRQATSELNSNNSQQVANLALDPVLNALERDFYGEDGVALNSEEDPEDTSGDPRLLDEPYDYAGDSDLWLASAQPYKDGSIARWRQISNIFPEREEDAFTKGNNAFAKGLRVDTAEDIENNDIVNGDSKADADGDGLVDARWTRAPVGQIGDLNYAVAYRVVDLSGLTNVNAHIGPSDGAGSFPGAVDNAPRWRYPSELNFFGWAANTTLINNLNSTEAVDLIAARVESGALPMTWDQLKDFWKDGVLRKFDTADYGSLGQLGNELELRRANGLNSPGSSTMLDELMPGFMREGDSAAAETDFTDAGFSDTTDSKLAYFAEEPRHQITTLGGSVPVRVAKASGDGNAASERVREDLNEALKTPAGMDGELRDFFNGMVDGASKFQAPDTFTSGGNWKYAAQLIACIVDYADADNTVTKVNRGTDFYGLEALPFVTEVYRQRNYKLEWQQSSDGNSYVAVWNQQGSTGYGIELRNCFNKTISLENVRLDIGNDGGNLIQLNQGGADLAEDNVLLIYHNADKGGGTETDIPSEIHNGAPDREIDGNQQPALEEAKDDEPIEIALQVKDSNGDWVTYQLTVAGKMDDSQLPNKHLKEIPGASKPDPGQLPAPGKDAIAYKRTSNFGNGNGLNMMTIVQSDFESFVKRSHTLGDNPEHGGDDSQIDKLGVADKAGDGPPDVIGDVDKNQIIIADYSDDKLRSVAELAHLVVLGFETDQTIPDRWISSNPGDPPDNVQEFMLPLLSDDMTKSDADALALPHAMLLLDRYTVNRYDDDGVDNNLNGTADEIREAFVPGMLNLNTVSKERLAGLLPIADEPTRSDLAELITAYRDRATPSGLNAPNVPSGLDFSANHRGLADGWREDDGIASIYELYAALWFVLGSDGQDNDALGGVPIDLADDPNGSATAETDNVTDDLEEKAFPIRWLSNVTNTRSDVFAVYVTVRGYEAGDWSPDGLKEQIRFVAIVDRSYLLNENADEREVKVLSIMQY